MLIRFFLATLIWVGILALQLTIMGIARFFEHTSGQKTWYQFYLLPLVLTVVSATCYLLRIQLRQDHWPDFAGDPLANILMFCAGLVLVLLSNLLYEKMIGGQRNEGS